ECPHSQLCARKEPVIELSKVAAADANKTASIETPRTRNRTMVNVRLAVHNTRLTMSMCFIIKVAVKNAISTRYTFWAQNRTTSGHGYISIVSKCKTMVIMCVKARKKRVTMIVSKNRN